MEKETVIIKNENETKALAKRLCRFVEPGSAFLLTGDLGAGKTTFTRYLCQELGIDTAQVTSPTFTVIHEYLDGKFPVAHVDLYRIGQDADVYELGLDEYLNRGFFIIMEWAEFMSEPLECPTFRLNLELLPDGQRKVELSFNRLDGETTPK